MNETPIAAGKSSFGLIDPQKVFDELNLSKDSVFLDLACGKGDYTIYAARFVDSKGIVYGVDLWKDGIEILKGEAKDKNLSQIEAVIADVSKRMPIENENVDICLMATVLHDLIEDNTEKNTLREVKRLVKPGGKLAVIEFKKKEGPGPPVHIRITPEEVESIITPYGFSFQKTVDLGDHNYMCLFQKEKDHK